MSKKALFILVFIISGGLWFTFLVKDSDCSAKTYNGKCLVFNKYEFTTQTTNILPLQTPYSPYNPQNTAQTLQYAPDVLQRTLDAKDLSNGSR